MQINLSGKRALISGGSRGIGLAIAKMFVEAGADVSICARTSAALDTALKSLETDGRKVIATQCDLSKPEEIKAWVNQSAQELGGIDILVNNASGFGQTDDEKGWELSVNVDLMASVRACHAALPYIEKQGGSIVHISSIS
jgi:3-oxoacyl-[acyl-carrier protein] reductase